MWRRNKHIDGKSGDVRLRKGHRVKGQFDSAAATRSETSDILNSALISDSGRLALISQSFVMLSALIYYVNQTLRSGQVRLVYEMFTAATFGRNICKLSEF